MTNGSSICPIACELVSLVWVSPSWVVWCKNTFLVVDGNYCRRTQSVVKGEREVATGHFGIGVVRRGLGEVGQEDQLASLNNTDDERAVRVEVWVGLPFWRTRRPWVARRRAECWREGSWGEACSHRRGNPWLRNDLLLINKINQSILFKHNNQLCRIW